MPWWTKPYSVLALILFALLLVIAVFLYIPVRLFVPYKRQIAWVYGINKVIMTVWSPLTGNLFLSRNAQKADRSKTYIVIMNHQNIMDMFAAARLLKIPGKPLVKKELLHIPILGWLFAMAAVSVSREDRASRNASYRAMLTELKRGISILVFPEGTRNSTDRPLIEFRDGAFRMALETGVPILPVVVMNTRQKSVARTAWFRPGKVFLHYLDPVDPAEFSEREEPVAALSDHCRLRMEEAILRHDPHFKTI